MIRAQVISGYCELLLRQIPEEDRIHGQISRILQAVRGMIDVTRKLQTITKYETREYIEGARIIDINKASEGVPSLLEKITVDV